MTCKFSLLTPIIGNFFGGPLPISAKAEFPIRTGAVANISGTTTLPPPGSPIAAFKFTGVSGGTIDGAGNVSGVGSVTVNINNTSSNAQTWDWDWGDLSATTLARRRRLIRTRLAGTYTVTLLVTNPSGVPPLSRTVTVTTVAVPPPVAGFYGTPLAGVAEVHRGWRVHGDRDPGQPAAGRPFHQPIHEWTAYSWDFGDGTAPDTPAGAAAHVHNLGVFTVTLTVTAPTGGTPMTRGRTSRPGVSSQTSRERRLPTAEATWSNAGFTGTIFYVSAQGMVGTSNPNRAESGRQSSTVQRLTAVISCRPPGKKQSPWICAGDITLRYK